MKLIDFAEKTLIKSYLKNYHPHFSEYSFTYLFIYSEYASLELFNDPFPFIKSVREKDAFLMPLIDCKTISPQHLANTLSIHQSSLYPLDSFSAKYLERENFHVKEEINYTEYVYLTEKLAFLRGAKLEKKRNRLHHFKTNYNFNVASITQENISDCLIVLNAWLKQSTMNKDTTDYHACLKALNHFNDLMLIGRLTYVEGKPISFGFGEKRPNGTFNFHFVKGCKKYKGIYEHIYSDMAKHLLNICNEISLEEDLGIESLKKAKLAYHPDRMIKKFSANVIL
ncbi:MAG: DUF2156 domain-containing protein [Parachlamydiales bacterium]|nr:DUF2156 domain-containing protein [Parachlamydiales bacterium]